MIKLRPHHLICQVCFQGEGYNEAFIQHFSAIHQALNDNPSDKQIEIISGADDICLKCPEKENGVCRNEEKVSKIDEAYSRLLDFGPDQTFSWDNLRAKMAHSLSLEQFHHACSACSWKASGICEKILKTFLR